MKVNQNQDFYCCGALKYQIENKHCPIDYSLKWREYSVQDVNSTSRSLMRFCPHCGTKLPLSLRDEWFDILEQEYELEDPMDDDKKKIPKDFLTDEWWKKRGLFDNNKKEKEDYFLLEYPERCLF